MLGYTNLESEKGFNFFQKFMKSSGAIDRLEELGIEEGDTVRVGDYLEFDYYRAYLIEIMYDTINISLHNLITDYAMKHIKERN